MTGQNVMCRCRAGGVTFTPPPSQPLISAGIIVAIEVHQTSIIRKTHRRNGGCYRRPSAVAGPF